MISDQIDMTLSSPADTMMVVVDPGLLMAAILKLAIAARDAMPDGGQVSITAAAARSGSRGHGGAATDVIEIKVDAVGSATNGRSPAWDTGDLVMIENLITLSGGDMTIDRHTDRIGFEIRLHKADASG